MFLVKEAYELTDHATFDSESGGVVERSAVSLPAYASIKPAAARH
jgi:hypothetical protein